MTENEKSITILKHMKNLLTIRTYEEEALEMAIQALEENQKYHAIGTIEECTEAVKNIEHFYMLGRNKAIDEFAERIREYCSMSDMNRKMIEQIAEQMKKENQEK